MEKPMDQKVKLIGSWLENKYTITELSTKFSVSRKTIYKWINRYFDEGVGGLEEKSRAAHNHPNETGSEKIDRIVDYKLNHRTWGPKKIIDCLKKKYPEETWPSASTAGDWLKKKDLVKNRKPRKHVHQYQDHFIECTKPNDVWSADYKGQFYTRDKKVCYPLTVTDNYSRYLIACDGLEGPRYFETKACFERIFREYGLPDAIRTDNGVPFAGLSIGGLSRLSIWWIQLGIIPERIKPGKPQQNGRHERMHRTLKGDTINPETKDIIDQQKKFDFFRIEYNTDRPHESIGMKRPGELYKRSNRSFPDSIKPIEYPDNFQIRCVKSCGQISFEGNRYYVSEMLFGDKVGLKEISDGFWQINYGLHKLGFIDLHKKKIIRYMN
jgi:transposase InsO family protein